MKKLVPIIFTAVLTSLFTAGIITVTSKEDKKAPISQTINTPVKHAAYTLNENNEFVPLDFTESAKKVMPAVVHIKSARAVQARTQQYQPNIPPQFKYFFPEFFQEPQGKPQTEEKMQMGSGSGVIINESGYIVTNNHVIDGADEIEVTLHNNKTYPATVIGTDPSTDIALIQIKESNLPFLSFNNSDGVEVGEWVLAVGNPFNLNSTVTAGIVSAKGRNINILKDQSAIESFIQTDAAINPGNSGGALVNLNGDLIGINTAIASPTGAYSGYGFAVPSNIVSKTIEDLLEYGVVQRGFLGVMIRSVDGNLASEEDLELTEGVYVSEFADNSAAEKAGIKKGDVIIEVEGKKIRTAPQLQEAIGRKRPGDEILVKVNRGGDIREYEVTLFNKFGGKELANKSKNEVFLLLGADFENIDKETAKKFDLDGGVMVKNIRSGKLKSYTKMRDGFIITKINHRKVNDTEDVTSILEDANGGTLIEGFYPDKPGKEYYAFGM